MALNFPANPTIGDTHSAGNQTYTWDGEVWTNSSGGGGGGASIHVGDTAPTDPEQGSLWWRTVEPVGMFIWYVDADSSQWVPADSAGTIASISEFHDPAGLASWRIVGSTLECWGAYNTGTSGVGVGFPKTFANNFPRVTLAVLVAGSEPLATYQYLSSVGFYGQGWSLTGTPLSANVSYHAIGEWDGVS